MTKRISKWVYVDMKMLNQCLHTSKITQKEVCDSCGYSLRSWAVWTIDNRLPANVFLEVSDMLGWLNEPTGLHLKFNSDL